MLTVELGGIIPGQQYDKLDISGTATLGGTLNVRLVSGFVPIAGQSFEFLAADAGVIDTFASTILPAMPASLSWQLQYGPNSVRLLLNQDPGVENPAGDYNGNGVVDAADYVVWRKAFGQLGGVADGNGDGRVDDADYTVWKTNLGRRAQTPAGGAMSGVPEPSTVAIGAMCRLDRGNSPSSSNASIIDDFKLRHEDRPAARMNACQASMNFGQHTLF